MTDFDARLRERLQRLDAAVPRAGAPSPPSIEPAPAPPRRRRQLIVLVAATVALLGATTLLASGTTPPPDPVQVTQDQAAEQRLRDDLAAHIGHACLTNVEATALVRQRLEALGLGDWSVRDDGHTRAAPCVGTAPNGEAHEVLLLPSMGGDLATALDALTADLMHRCLGTDAALRLLWEALTAQGVNDPRTETGDVQGIPLEYGDAYAQHVADGCAVYGGAMWDDAGRYTWFIRDR